MEKAKLVVTVGKGIVPVDTIPCQFNPETITIEKGVKYDGKNSPIRDFPELNYSGGNSGSFSLDLFFDAFCDDKYNSDKNYDVRKRTDQLMRLALRAYGYGNPLTATIPILDVPPMVNFVWGKLILFKAVVSKVTTSFIQFSDEGIPTQAKCAVTFLEKDFPLDILPPMNPSSRSDPRKTTRVQRGDRLDWLAYQEYGDARRWRMIAEANHIDDPFTLQDGRLLSLPQE